MRQMAAYESCPGTAPLYYAKKRHRMDVDVREELRQSLRAAAVACTATKSDYTRKDEQEMFRSTGEPGD